MLSSFILAAYVHLFWVRPPEYSSTRLRVNSTDVVEAGSVTDYRVSALQEDTEHCFELQHYGANGSTDWSLPLCTTVKKKEARPTFASMISGVEN